METVRRQAFQGIGNILRFNWHFYVLAILFLAVLYLTKQFAGQNLQICLVVISILLTTSLLLSLLVSFYVYDLSGFYNLNWLQVELKTDAQLVNVHSGFDETSALLAGKYPTAALRVFDFYDPCKHTEVSIKRARKKSLAYPGTKTVNTNNLPLSPASVDCIFCILAAHEIRERSERVMFFKQLGKSLKEGGRIVVVEHMRDLPNFIAYTIGAFHFHSSKEWEKTIYLSGLSIEKKQRINPFITAYSLKNGNAS
jgi:SAM-dependent methyltransferase